jgi:hypothetical protein
VGRRSRRRAHAETRDGAPREELIAPGSEYTDAEGNALVLRGALTAAARREYADALAGAGARAARTPEDAWQRATELLFERLALSWTIAQEPIEGQRELLRRYRVASPAERAWVRDALREHCAANFPDVKAP